jgi:hypothetical protein
MISSEFCPNAAKVIRKATGWNFGNILFRCFGDTSIVLKNEGPNGEDLEFSVNEEWVRNNHPYPIELIGSEEAYEKLRRQLQHVSECQCNECTEAKKRMRSIVPYLQPENRKIPGGEALLLLHAITPNCLHFVTSKEDAPSLVDEFKPFFLWFIEEPELWTPQPKK